MYGESQVGCNMYDIESSRREECTIRVRLMRGIYNES